MNEPNSAATTTITTSLEDDQEVDEFLSSRGFEFIDGNNDSRGRVLDSDDDSTGKSILISASVNIVSAPSARPNSQTNISVSRLSATPGLARVIDALSTIMWPSMIQSSHPSSGPASKRVSRARELLDWARQEESEDGLCALVQSPIDETETEGDTDDPSSPTDPSTALQAKPKTSRMQKEIDEFQRWLEEDESQRVNEDPWARRDELPGTKTPTMAISIGSGTGFGDGFEDDFTDFIGAPMDHEPRRPESNSTKGRPFGYTSLDSEFDALKDDDGDFPSQDEIEAATRRIFGSASSPHPPTSASGSLLQHQYLSATNISGLSASPAPSTSTLGDDDDFGIPRFDLSRVFSTLQVMKDEISEMTDDEERRRAAARVALGLVYGLERDEDTDVQ